VPAPPFPLGHAISRADLEADPHPHLARLREHEPVSWLPALNGWLVTRRDLALLVMRDTGTFTVDDPRFSTARVVGPSMLSLDGAEHARHRAPFTGGFSRAVVADRLGAFVAAQAETLLAELRSAGTAEMRTVFAGPIAVAVVADALGLGAADPDQVLTWYRSIVGAVSALTGDQGHQPDGARREDVISEGAQAFGALSGSLRSVLGGGGHSLLEHAATAAGTVNALSTDEVISNAAVLMFGGIETTEGMIANALLHLLSHPDQLSLVQGDPSLLPNAVEESLRLEPAAALVDRYAVRDVELGGAAIKRGDLVSVSLAGAGRDPAVFDRPGEFYVRRPNARVHLAFAHGPHFCLGADLARLETLTAVRAALRLPGLRLDPDRPSAIRGLVFRKPATLWVRWDRE
jgi:cytochrome P450